MYQEEILKAIKEQTEAIKRQTEAIELIARGGRHRLPCKGFSPCLCEGIVKTRKHVFGC